MAVTPTTWNPSDKHANIVLSGGNLVASRTEATNQWDGVRSIFGASSGKYYWEITITTQPSWGTFRGQNFGVGTIAAPLNEHNGTYDNGWAYARTGSIYYVTNNIVNTTGVIGFAQGSIIMIALDMDTGKLWWGVDGVWINGGDPSAGTGAQYTNLSGTIYALSNLYIGSDGCAQTANFGASALAYTVPSGFQSGFGPLAQWTITASSGLNGSISPSGAVTVDGGGNQAFTIVPSTGYYNSDVLVDSVSVGQQSSYTFSNVAADHTISATFALPVWPDSGAVQTIIHGIVNDPDPPVHFTDTMILAWTNEAVHDIASKTACIETILPVTTTSGSRLVPFAGHKVRYVEYLPTTGNRIGLQAITSKNLGHLPYNSITPQYWFQWGTDIIIDPKPTATYNLNLYVSQWPDYLMSDLDDEPLVDLDFQILIIPYVLFKTYLRDKKFRTAAFCYQMYAAGINEIKARRIKRQKDHVAVISLPEMVARIKGGQNYSVGNLR